MLCTDRVTNGMTYLFALFLRPFGVLVAFGDDQRFQRFVRVAGDQVCADSKRALALVWSLLGTVLANYLLLSTL